jgi:hypothetical protein
VNGDESKPSPWAAALSEPGPDRKAKLAAAADDLRLEMERAAARVRDLVLLSPPVELLGFLWVQLGIGSLRDEGDAPQKDLHNQYQFALEYVHAVWCCHTLPENPGRLEESAGWELVGALEDLRVVTMNFIMVSTLGAEKAEFGKASDEVEFHAKSSWVALRGNRYQVLEGEFLRFVLQPHDGALRAAYGVGADEIAAGIQSISDTMRTGIADAANAIEVANLRAVELAAREKIDLGAAVERLRAEDPEYGPNVDGAMLDMLFGGTCNVSRHTQLPRDLLDDLAFEPGANTEFFAPGHYCGTPLRTLPARVRPLVKLRDDFYAVDSSFVRDVAYRAIQRGLCARTPAYRNVWNAKQKPLIEGAFPIILARQLSDARVYQDAYYPDPDTGNWTETDLVAILEDVLLVVEAKAGVAAMHSPATNYDSHVRTIKRLVVDAYEQTKRFLRHLEKSPDAPIYRLSDGKYVEVAKIRRKDFRAIFPIGLTVESFSPFSAMCKELPEIEPLLGTHPFISMSVDDLFVLNRLLPSAGNFFHYLEVRQQVAGIRGAMLFDEFDHLGAYISKNRFDVILREQLEEADMVAWDAFSDTIDAHFSSDDWEAKQAPAQPMPKRLEELLAALDRSRASSRLRCDAFIRNLSDVERSNLDKTIHELSQTLVQFPLRKFVMGNDQPVQYWLFGQGRKPSDAEVLHGSQIACLVCEKSSLPVVLVELSPKLEIISAVSRITQGPSVIQLNYAELKAAAVEAAKRVRRIKKPRK